ncbi:MAG: ubiquitin-conjugating enzyme E2 [Harvfovirus sp.]|uniref:E2 ubiquitin-conjugating enzyme n=1 Tax=Harvfovirus sp. TaxID=2487768 RepID=A0A3G5A7K0_9VIRU|nr:MAG: ubiquitin-conjugating enzyme E2 [Harvfovirus sp.]
MAGHSVDAFIAEGGVWNSKRNLISLFEKVLDSGVLVSFVKNGCQVLVTCPVGERDSYIVESKNKQYRWIDDVNIYCLEKKPTPSKLLNVLSKQIAVVQDIVPVVEAVGGDIIVDRDLGFDFEKYKKTKELEALINMAGSKSVVADVRVSGVGAAAVAAAPRSKTQLFGQAVVGKIIITEFMKLWELARNPKVGYKIDIVDNNIYRWKVRYTNFVRKELNASLTELTKMHGYGYIEVDILFHDTMYPNYPPIIKVLRPRLLNSLMHQIANTKMTQLDYWVPSRNMTFIVNKLQQLFEKHAKIYVDTEMNDREKYSVGSFLPIETHLLDLASFVDIGNSDDIDDEVYTKISGEVKGRKAGVGAGAGASAPAPAPGGHATVWKSGTGYGHGGSAAWDIDSYLKSLAERDKQAQKILSKIILEIQDAKSPRAVYSALQYSVLMRYIKSLLSETPLLEIRKHMSLYNMIFTLLSNLANEDAIFLFDKVPDKPSEKSLYEIFVELEKMCISAKRLYNQDAAAEDDLINTIMNLFSMIKPCYDNYLLQHKIKHEKIKEEETKLKTEAETYTKHMTSLRDADKDYKIVNTNYHYQSQLTQNKASKANTKAIKRLNDEILLFRSLPINYDAIIIARADENYQSAIRTLMTGPVNTPYEGGCFLFDTYVHSEFPNSSPMVWFLNTGGKRMNPNLYDSGKVCLSILGTWGGDRGGESWNPDISTIALIYKSVQSQILIEQPYFNEPGYESHYNGAAGMAQSKQYNNNIRLYTMQHAMLDLINNPKTYPQFEDVITSHFKMKKDKICAICEKWVEDAPVHFKPAYLSVFNQIKVAIKKLV